MKPNWINLLPLVKNLNEDGKIEQFLQKMKYYKEVDQFPLMIFDINQHKNYISIIYNQQGVVVIGGK